jgi:hypothetical protein
MRVISPPLSPLFGRLQICALHVGLVKYSQPPYISADGHAMVREESLQGAYIFDQLKDCKILKNIFCMVFS